MKLENNREKRLGNIFGATGGSYAGQVYDTNYLGPSLTTMQGGDRQPMIVDRICIRSIGRDPNNPNDRSTGNPNLEQRLELNENGTTNTISSVQKDNYILEISVE